jgi:hypothetical protein
MLNALITEGRKVQRLVFTQADKLSDGAAGGWSMLDTVPRKPRGDEQVRDAWDGTDDRIMIEQALIVVAGPCPLQTQLLKRGNTMREQWPQCSFQQVEVRVEIIAWMWIRVLRRRNAA